MILFLNQIILHSMNNILHTSIIDTIQIILSIIISNLNDYKNNLDIFLEYFYNSIYLIYFIRKNKQLGFYGHLDLLIQFLAEKLQLI